MGDPVLTGSCQCGDVRYRITAQPTWVGHCHCGMCRRMSGAPFITWMTVPAHSVAWQGKAPALFRASPLAQRGHCPTCGAQIAWQGTQEPHNIDIAVATLSDPGAVRASMHIYWDDRMPGIELADRLPKYRQGHRDSPLVEE
jgi:hypothetical protein